MKLNNPKCSIQRNVKLRKENEQYRSPDAWFSVDVALALVVSENDKKNLNNGLNLLKIKKLCINIEILL